MKIGAKAILVKINAVAMPQSWRKVAGLAKNKKTPLIIRNLKDFQKIEGLQLVKI